MAWSPLAGGRIFDAESKDERIVRVRAALKKVSKELDLSIDEVSPDF
jgi:predicted oxidoreductase